LIDDPFAVSKYSVELPNQQDIPPRVVHTPLSFIRQIIINIFVILTGAYAIHITLFIVLRTIVGEQWKLISFYNNFTHLMLLPAFILLPATLLLRRWRLSAGMLPAIITFVILYAPIFVPSAPVSMATDAQVFSVMTFNIHAERHALDGMTAIIHEANADIVALQEVSLEAADILAAQFADIYPHQVFATTDNPVQGQAVLSRLPIVADESWQTSTTVPILQRVEIAIGDEIIALYNVHAPIPFDSLTSYEPGRRSAEIDQMIRRATQDSTTVILAGDFNMSDQSDDYRHITTHFVDSYRDIGNGFGFTFPDFRNNRLPRYVDTPMPPLPPLMRIDYIFHNEIVQAVEAHVWHTSGGSDHRPVLVYFAVDAS